jgi:zinc protease
MHTSYRLKLVAWCFLLLPAMTASGKPAAEDTVTEAMLDNGLKVLIKEDHRAPVVVSQIWYRIGGSYEPDGITGISHVLEHMMFKGTKNHPTGDFDRIISENGGSGNAFTGRDYTAYFQKLEKSRLNVSLELESDRMQNLLLDPAEFKKELQVVIEERRLRTEDKPESKVYEKFMAAAFPGHPYGRPIIGWMRDLEKLTLDELQTWYQRYYSPANAVLVVAGDVDPQAVLKAARDTYGKVPAAKVERSKRPVVPGQDKVRRLVVKAPANVPYLIMGFHVPAVVDQPANDWEPYALEVLSGILDGGDAARFFDQLIRTQQVATAAGTDYDPFARLAGFFIIDANPADGKTVEDLEQAILGQLDRLKTTPVTEAELDRVKAQIIASDTYELDSVFYQGMKLGLLESTLSDWRLTEQHSARLQAVTAEQVMAVAKKYFNENSMTVAVLDPQPVNTSVEVGK